MQPIPPPPKQKPQLPGSLKAILVLKTLACLAILGLTFIAITAFNATVGRHTADFGDEGRQTAHALGQILMLIAGAQIAQLIGIVGTWSFKRWGVYTLASFSMLDAVLNLKANNHTGLVIGIMTSLIAGFAIAARWKDFE